MLIFNENGPKLANHGYIGRFAPSPSGPLHFGSLVAAMASFLDARAHRGQWLLRIEDVDLARSVAGAADDILATLREYGMNWDGEVVYQSQRDSAYRTALAQLKDRVFACTCSRREIAERSPGPGSDGAPVYAGTCRSRTEVPTQAHSIRLRVPDSGEPGELVQFHDRHLGMQQQHLATEVGDFVLLRADGYWAYQLAVVVDDAWQGVTDVVRGMDLLDSTARQIYLQHALGYPAVRYLHVPVVTNEAGEKLSKQTGAPSIRGSDILANLQRAARHLQLELPACETLTSFWTNAIGAWREHWGIASSIEGDGDGAHDDASYLSGIE